MENHPSLVVIGRGGGGEKDELSHLGVRVFERIHP